MGVEVGKEKVGEEALGKGVGSVTRNGGKEEGDGCGKREME